MGETTIEWCDSVWNPVTGCQKVSEGCRFCYAERVFPRAYSNFCRCGHETTDHNHGESEFDGLEDCGLCDCKAFVERKFTDILTHPDRLEQPLHWKKPRRVFVNSMSDLFHEDVPFEFIAAVFGIMAASEHTFQVLTKRAGRMLEWSRWVDSYGGIGCYVRSDEGRAALRVIIGESSGARFEKVNGRRWRTSEDAWAQVMNAAACVGRGGPLPNVWLGVSCEDQKTADERIPLLLQTPAVVRFVSYEPALEAVRLKREWFEPLRVYHSCNIHWLIIGGESGPGARPFNLQWARDVIAQCKVAGVAVFVKQMGSCITGINLDGPPYSSPPRREGFLIHWTNREANTFGLCDRKGGDPAEWADDLRIREFPSP